MATSLTSQPWTYASSVASSTPAPSHTTGTGASTAVPTPAPTQNGGIHHTLGVKSDQHTTHTSQSTTHHSSTTTNTVIQSAITKEVKTAMTHVLSNVPWMKFRIHAEPDLAVFENDVVLQQALTQISQVAATSIAQTITSDFTKQMETLIHTVTQTAATQISATMVQLIQELVKVSTLTHASTNAGALIIPGIPDCITGDIVPYPHDIVVPHKPGYPVHPEHPTHPTGAIVGPNFDAAHPTPSTPDLSKASWIWTRECLAGNPPGGARPFRKTYTTDTLVDHLAIDITTDNYYTLYINGHVVGSGRDWTKVQRYQVTFPPTHTVTVAVYGVQDPIYVAQAGVLAAATVWSSTDSKAGVHSFFTDATWKTIPTQNFPSNFVSPGFPDVHWDHATREGPYGMAPWGAVAKPLAFTDQNGPLTQLPGGIPNAPSAPAAHVIIS